MDKEEKKGQKERGDGARCSIEQGARPNLGGGGERKEPKSSLKGNIET